MFKIMSKTQLNNDVFAMEIHAPLTAKKAKAGQFIMLRVAEGGERIPLTIAGVRGDAVRIIFQTVGKTTMWLSELPKGGHVRDFVGPLGEATDLPSEGRVIIIAGGLGAAIALPQARELAARGVTTDVILGFRTADLIILEDEFRALKAGGVYVMTDDGSNGNKGLVTDKLREIKGDGAAACIAIGPLPMMRAVCDLTREYGIKTTVSMNSTMVDGTGMCGCCRVTVGGKVRFACVDGPDFDGHLVDFDEAILRQRMYAEQERSAREAHICKMKGRG
ncbi:MAG: sulfide/dihydroorotate dehydrogenase-like FAD/NAD-binding protein [Clostridiales bacterium]|jgi:ferredoxin--NADP+ reductase|nr:sulfide/dihydroorotate dehydrogenase-like FAD/NAD-binding protein [Clostridiales bacterium]